MIAKMDFQEKVKAILDRWEEEWIRFAEPQSDYAPAQSDDLALEILDLILPAFTERYADLYPPA
mgnify:CR=1 FL=1